MAGDNPKVSVDVDVEDAFRKGQQWGENFVRGVNQKVSDGGIAGQVLGSGQPVNPAGSPQSVTALLSSILTTLQQGFGNLVVAAGGAGAPPSGAGPSSGGGAAPPPPSGGGGGGEEGDEEERKKRRRRGSVMSGVYAASGFPQQAYANMYNSGFYGTQVAQFAAQATSNIPIVGQFLGMVANTMAERDNALRDMMGVYRAGGNKSWSFFHDLMTGSSASTGAGNTILDRAKMLGVGRSEAAQLLTLNAQAGDSRQGGFEALLSLQGLYGMGQQGASLTGALQRGGSRDVGSSMNLFATVLANAVTSGLDRGRWGEAFSALSKAAGRIQGGDVSTSGLLQTMNLVGAMGTVSGRYQGDTEASNRAYGMFQGMQEGQGGAFANIAALRAAGLGQAGVSFTDAWMKVQRGGAEGGVGLKDVLRQYMNLPPVRAYLTNPTEKNLNRAVFILSTLLPAYKPADIEAMLRTMSKFDIANKGLPEQNPRARDAYFKALTQGRLKTKMQDLAESDASLNWSKNAIGDREGQMYGMPEDIGELTMQGGQRTGPDVVTAPGDGTADGGIGMEGYGVDRGATGGVWPMRPGDDPSLELKNKPGFRRAKPGDRHMARDVVIGNGRPGEKVYAPMAGVWLTNTPYLANRKDQKQGYIGEMLGDNGTRFKFMHLYFEPSLRKGKRVEAGDLIGTVAEGPPGWTPHLHLEARKKIAGKTTVVDPMGATQGGMDASMHDIMTGKAPRPAPPAAPTTAPDFSDDSGKPIADPDKVVPVSSRATGSTGGIEVSINLTPEARRLLSVNVQRKPATRRGVVG